MGSLAAIPPEPSVTVQRGIPATGAARECDLAARVARRGAGARYSGVLRRLAPEGTREYSGLDAGASRGCTGCAAPAEVARPSATCPQRRNRSGRCRASPAKQTNKQTEQTHAARWSYFASTASHPATRCIDAARGGALLGVPDVLREHWAYALARRFRAPLASPCHRRVAHTGRPCGGHSQTAARQRSVVGGG
jgi:hypothetical protein